MGCSDREPDTRSVEPTLVGEMPALDLTPVSEMSLGNGDLTGLLVVTMPLVVDDSAPLVRCCFHRMIDATPVSIARGTVESVLVSLRVWL
jgi:hypothetical protein